MFIAALFTITKTWKQSKCPPTDECIKKTVYIGQYIQWTYYSAKRNEIMSFAPTWMDLDIIILSKESQTKTNIQYHLYVESKQ